MLGKDYIEYKTNVLRIINYYQPANKNGDAMWSLEYVKNRARHIRSYIIGTINQG